MRYIQIVSAVLFALFITLTVACEKQQPPQTKGQGQSTSTSPGTSQSQARAPGVPAQPESREVRLGGGLVSFEGVENAQADTSRNFIIVLDQSLSMNEPLSREEREEFARQGISVSTRLDGAKWAIEKYITSAPENINLGLYVFSKNAQGLETLVPLGKGNRAEILIRLRALSCWNGGTPLGEAIKGGTDVVVEQYKKQLGYGEYRLIVVTDGEDNGSYGIPRAAAYAQKFGVPIYTIGFAVRGKHALEQYSLWYRQASGAMELAESLKETLAETEAFDTSTFPGGQTPDNQ